MAIHFSFFAWKFLRTEELAGYSPKGGKESDMTEWLSTHQAQWQKICGDPGSIPDPEDSLEKETANLLQYSCLGNPMDRGAWQAIVHEVAKSQTQLSNNNYDISFHIVNSLVSWSQGSMWFSPLFSQLLALVWVVAGTSKVLVGG